MRFELKDDVLVGFIKVGNIGSSPLLEFLFDERADRDDIKTRTLASGAKLGPEESEEIAKKMVEFKPDLVICSSPNATLPGPSKMRSVMADAGIPTIIVSDAPGRKAKDDIEEKGQGYIIVTADPMIGARREFLDPTEMVIFNADIIKLLAATGVFRLIQMEIDRVIDEIKKGKEPELPKIIVNKERAVAAGEFQNPYAAAKAMAAYEIARRVADLSVEGCFKIKESDRYIPIVTAAHEVLRTAVCLADEAREIEKYGDYLSRTPHKKDGTILHKLKLMEKPS